MKYFNWKNSEYMQGGDLLDRRTISKIAGSMPSTTELYATIQDYDNSGRIIGCPVYFDIDSDSLYDAYESTKGLVASLEEDFDVKAWTYFSGSKGFHVVLPLYIRHPRCHEIMAIIAEDYSSYDYDSSVYRTRSMWRMNNSFNTKGTFKVQVSMENSLECIIKMSRDRLHDPIGIWKLQDMDVSEYKLPEFNQVDRMKSSYYSLVPCLESLWKDEVPAEGTRHQLAYIMAKHCYNVDMGIDEAIDMFAKHSFWKSVNTRDYEKVIESVYRTGNSILTCKGRDGDILKERCTVICAFNPEFNKLMRD